MVSSTNICYNIIKISLVSIYLSKISKTNFQDKIMCSSLSQRNRQNAWSQLVTIMYQLMRLYRNQSRPYAHVCQWTVASESTAVSSYEYGVFSLRHRLTDASFPQAPTPHHEGYCIKHQSQSPLLKELYQFILLGQATAIVI